MKLNRTTLHCLEIKLTKKCVWFHSQVEQHSQSGCRTESDQQRPGLQGGAVKTWTAWFGRWQRSLSVGVGRHEYVLQKGQRLDQVLGGFSGDVKGKRRKKNVMRDEKDKLLIRNTTVLLSLVICLASCSYLSILSSRDVTAHPQSSGTLRQKQEQSNTHTFN